MLGSGLRCSEKLSDDPAGRAGPPEVCSAVARQHSGLELRDTLSGWMSGAVMGTDPPVSHSHIPHTGTESSRDSNLLSNTHNLLIAAIRKVVGVAQTPTTTAGRLAQIL